MNQATTIRVPERIGIQGNCATLFVSLELSRSTWVATALAPGSSKMSKHTLVGGDGHKLLHLLARFAGRHRQRGGIPRCTFRADCVRSRTERMPAWCRAL